MTRRPTAEETSLFDLPLEPVDDQARPDEEAAQRTLPLTPGEAPVAADAGGATTAPTPSPRPGQPVAGLRPRLTAGLTDLGLCAAVLAALLLFLWSTGTEPTAADLPAAILFLLAFSFLYQVLPLAFWGRTPGMSLAGVRATTAAGGPLTFRQTILRWLGSVLTVALVGLPVLLALTGRSLTDRLSSSVTRIVPGSH